MNLFVSALLRQERFFVGASFVLAIVIGVQHDFGAGFRLFIICTLAFQPIIIFICWPVLKESRRTTNDLRDK